LANEFHNRGQRSSSSRVSSRLTLSLATLGCHVIATARKLDQLRDIESKGVTVLPLDVTSKESIAACKAKVEELTGGRLDILVNNA
jgi:1-acylglycerone phosphate reductase